LLTDWDAIEGDWLVALAQDGGRGRQGREWVSEHGNFFGSTLVMVRSSDPPPVSLSLVAGLALIEAADNLVPGLSVMLKWPNDLLLNGRKLGGILLERSGDRVVAGFGLNLAVAPEVPGRKTASLDAPVTPEAFAPLLAASFEKLVDLWRSSVPMLMANAWLARAHPVGTPLTIHIGPDESRSGRFAGIENDGALRLRTGHGIEIIRAGDVDLK
jgi:BirA family transcriptional regulator, biotin operon repressor / biotin---[acetyl-CoA-carboxylase] ligase